jgi:hypothetical protein
MKFTLRLVIKAIQPSLRAKNGKAEGENSKENAAVALWQKKNRQY